MYHTHILFFNEKIILLTIDQKQCNVSKIYLTLLIRILKLKTFCLSYALQCIHPCKYFLSTTIRKDNLNFNLQCSSLQVFD